MSSETDFRTWVRGRWPGWIEGREPQGRRRSGWGSGRGAPDLMLGVELPEAGRLPAGLVFPLQCELKKARVTHGTKLVSESAVNPDQVRWHGHAASKRVLAAFLWGVPLGETGWRAYVLLPGDGMGGWAELSACEELPADERAFAGALSAWTARRLGL